VKINAYLEQKLGFKDVNRLKGGIISYTRELEAIQNLSLSKDISSVFILLLSQMRAYVLDIPCYYLHLLMS
jgi:hypothetical protein